jgi:hypothetical protein
VVKPVLRICSEAKISISSTKRFADFIPAAKKHNIRKRVTNWANFDKDVLRTTIFRFYDKGEVPTSKKLALDLRERI